jgi:hypothetical protein
MNMTRREAVQRIAALAAAPLVASCGADSLLSPSLSLSVSDVGPVTLIGAGDPHVRLPGHPSYAAGRMIASMLAADPSAKAFCIGDLVETGTAAQYRDLYSKAWGAFKARTLPGLGNHDDQSDPAAKAYFDYWGTQAGPRGKGYYAITLGNWRVYVLNSERWLAEQSAWLAADLPNYSRHHIMAFCHTPHFVSPCRHPNVGTVRMGWPGPSGMGQFWEQLQRHKAELFVSGHVHRFERFPRMLRDPRNPYTGIKSPDGIRQFVVGTGGTGLMTPATPHPYVEKIVVAHGVIRLTLHVDRYEWRMTALNGVVRDSGTQACRKVLAA